jgi:FkbM family methyltransferase
MLEEIRPNDLIWDIGANVGLYSVLLAQAAPNGQLVAFEPNESCYERLTRNISDNALDHVTVEKLAMSDRTGYVDFANDGALASTLGHIVTDHSDVLASSAVQVKSITGDGYLAQPGVRIPNFIKIDVEGFEREVLFGLKEGLAQPECRVVFCEIHSKILANRGISSAPKDIRRLLQSSGFSDFDWIDSSHIVALKRLPRA